MKRERPNELDMTIIGARIKMYRVKRGLTPEQLGVYAGTSGAYIRKIEKGNVKAPGIDIIHSVAHVLDISPSQLLDDGINATVTASPRSYLQFVNTWIPVYRRLPVMVGDIPIDYVACSTFEPDAQSLLGYRISHNDPRMNVETGDMIIIDTKREPSPDSVVIVISKGEPKLQRYNELRDKKYFGVVTCVQHHLEPSNIK